MLPMRTMRLEVNLPGSQKRLMAELAFETYSVALNLRLFATASYCIHHLLWVEFSLFVKIQLSFTSVS